MSWNDYWQLEWMQLQVGLLLGLPVGLLAFVASLMLRRWALKRSK